MLDIKNSCFVCKKPISRETTELNPVVNMPVCPECKGSDREKKEEKEVLNSLADGFVCGCI